MSAGLDAPGRNPRNGKLVIMLSVAALTKLWMMEI